MKNEDWKQSILSMSTEDAIALLIPIRVARLVKKQVKKKATSTNRKPKKKMTKAEAARILSELGVI